MLETSGSFGSLGAFARYDITLFGNISTTGPNGVFAGTEVSDFVTITGESGAGTLRIFAHVEGSTTISPGFGAYAIVSGSSFAGAYNSDPILSGPIDLSFDLPFTFGDAFELKRGLNVNVGGFFLSTGTYEGVADFLHTVGYSYLVLNAQSAAVDGASLVSDTGYVYELTNGPSGIPEPSAIATLFAGLMTLLGLRRSNRRHG